MAISKSAQAVAWLVDNPGATASEAAKKFGITKGTLSTALRLRDEFGCCPTCGQTLREGDAPGLKPGNIPAQS